MDANRSKRNFIALLIAIPIIVVLSQTMSWMGIDGLLFFKDIDIARSSDEKVEHSGESFHRLIDLSGEWYFAAGDDLTRSLPGFDHSEWETIKVPDTWEDQGYKQHDGFAWYRREFTLDEKNLTQSLRVLLGRVDDVDEVYINGNRIGGTGQFPPTYVGAWNEDRQYNVAREYLKTGSNVIAVRVYDALQDGGIYEGNIGIYASDMPEMHVDLKGTWGLSLGNTRQDFQAIQVPGAWEDQGFENYDGMAWYKKEFETSTSNIDGTMVLMLGKIDDTDEVFLNGHLIGRTGNLDENDRHVNSNYYRIQRNYEFEANILDTVNTLEVRVHDSSGAGGIYEGPVGIMPKSDYLSFVEKRARSD